MNHMLAKPEEAGLRAHREALLANATGDVLEICGGTGANLRLYGEGVHTLTITEPEKPMIRRLRRHIQAHRPDTKLLYAPAEDLPFNDDSFDVAISTLVLCTVDDQPRALRELHRVLRPGGKLLFIEHVRSDDPNLARTQDRMHPLNVRIGQRLPLQPPHTREPPLRRDRRHPTRTRHAQARAALRASADRGCRGALRSSAPDPS
jgi:ubiquinone/menaquinone biosynthesis C-methylase UbiE